jgi:hypothetical protein
MAKLLSIISVADVASRFQLLVPERYQGDLFDRLHRVLDPSLPGSTTLLELFSAAAFLASNSHMTVREQLDGFLLWVIDQGYAAALARWRSRPLPLPLFPRPSLIQPSGSGMPR